MSKWFDVLKKKRKPKKKEDMRVGRVYPSDREGKKNYDAYP